MEDTPGKTCQNIGATMTYQLTVKQVQAYAMRESKIASEIVRIYKKWRFNAKMLLDNVEINEMTYEEVEKLINHKSSEDGGIVEDRI